MEIKLLVFKILFYEDCKFSVVENEDVLFRLLQDTYFRFVTGNYLLLYSSFAFYFVA